MGKQAIEKNTYHLFEGETTKVKATIDRTFADTIDVKLPCGYRQRFWVDFTDAQAYEQLIKMKAEGITSE